MTQNEAAGRPAGREQQPAAACPMVLELIIAATEPPSGTVRAAGSQTPVAFHGWIDLMAAISSLGDRSQAEPDLSAAEPRLPGGHSPR
jgi:hypothetical protein